MAGPGVFMPPPFVTCSGCGSEFMPKNSWHCFCSSRCRRLRHPQSVKGSRHQGRRLARLGR